VIALAGNRFLVIGRAGMDLSPTPPGTAIGDATAFRADLGGSAANIAAGLCRLGARAAMLTSLSDDGVGRFCLAQLAHYGIDTTHVRTVGGEARTSLALSETRVACHETVIYRNGAADFRMTTEDVERVDFAAYDAIVAAGTVFAAEPSRQAAFRAFDLARAAGRPIVFDIDYRPYSWTSATDAADVLSRAGAAADAIIGNDAEFGFMAGDMDRGLAKARALAESSAALVIYKRGEAGAITLAGDREFATGIYPVAAVKPTGAGDSFMAGLLSALAEGRDLRDAVLRGSAAAAIVVAKPGCAPAMPTPAELEDFLARHPGPTQP
jgi:5-dehydro-2-deoxygluconokinase